jgi:hypothetical protein
MRQVRRVAETGQSRQRSTRSASPAAKAMVEVDAVGAGSRAGPALDPAGRGRAGREAQVLAWQWALANRSADGSLPSGRDIGHRYGRHERWGRLVKRAGLAGEPDPQA